MRDVAHGLDVVQRPEDDDDEQNGAQYARAAIAPVPRVRENREGPEQQQQKNDDDNQFQGVPPKRNVQQSSRCKRWCSVLSEQNILMNFVAHATLEGRCRSHKA